MSQVNAGVMLYIQRVHQSSVQADSKGSHLSHALDPNTPQIG